MKIQYVPYIKTPAGSIAVCVSDLLHQGGGLLQFVAVPKVGREGELGLMLASCAGWS